jgi:hypothetical protein
MTEMCPHFLPITMNIGRRILASRSIASAASTACTLTMTKSVTSSEVRGLKTKAHYEAHSTDSYEDAYFYEPGPYTEYLKDLVKDLLGLDQNHQERILLDIGGGTGNFTQMIIENSQTKAIVVDPFLVDESRDKDNKIQFVRAPAEIFKESAREEDKWWRQGYHKVLLKEVIHHIDDNDRVAVLRGIRQGLSNVGKDLPSLLIITRPQVEIDYPLWPEAKSVWAKNQPSSEALVQDLNAAGFSKVMQSIEAYPCSIPLDRWLGMIKQRFWSTFSSFSDQELEAACVQIAKTESHRLDEDGVLHFEDRLVFLTANS